MAKFSEERVSWWTEFLRNAETPPTTPDNTPWPLQEIGQYQEAQSNSTLGAKEKGLMAKYLNKRNEFKEVNLRFKNKVLHVSSSESIF